MIPVKLANGNIRVPKRAEDDASPAIGDGFMEIESTHPDYDKYVAYMETDQYKVLLRLQKQSAKE